MQMSRDAVVGSSCACGDLITGYLLTFLWVPTDVHVAHTSCPRSSLCNTLLQP